MKLTDKRAIELYNKAKLVAPKLKLDLENTKFVANVVVKSVSTKQRGYFKTPSSQFLSIKFYSSPRVVFYRITDDGRTISSTRYDCGGHMNKKEGFSNNIKKEKYLSTFLCTCNAYALTH